jgi:hypothetical protein
LGRGTTAVPELVDREIQIHQTPRSNTYDAASYNVVGGPLSLEFNELMLRPPGVGERDLVIDDDLQVTARESMEKENLFGKDPSQGLLEKMPELAGSILEREGLVNPAARELRRWTLCDNSLRLSCSLII